MGGGIRRNPERERVPMNLGLCGWQCAVKTLLMVLFFSVK